MKSSPTLKITLRQPCTQSWANMAPTDGGRYCQHCQHVVTDFTQMSDVQMLRAVAGADGKVCGRFRPSQLDRGLELPIRPPQRAWPRLAVGALLLMATMPHALLAQTPAIDTAHPTSGTATSIVVIDGKQISVVDPPIVEDLTLDTIVRIRVRVLDRKTQERIAFASVKVDDFLEPTNTGPDGELVIELPRWKLGKDLFILAAAPEYQWTVVYVPTDSLPEEVVIYPEPEQVWLMGLIEAPRLSHKNWKTLSKAEKAHLKEMGVDRPKKITRRERKSWGLDVDVE